MVLDRVNSSTRNTGGNPTTAGVDFHGKRIQAGLSTQIVIQVTDDTVTGQKFVVGAVQSLSVTETRDVVAVHEVGTDAIVELVPRSATTYTLDIDRMVFDFQRLPQALQREYRHIHAQRRPFDIVITDYNPYLLNQTGPQTPDSGPSNALPAQSTAINTVFGNCWFTRLTFSYKANDYLITESCSMSCEYVKDEAAPATLQGATDSLERNTATSATASIMSGFDATKTP